MTKIGNYLPLAPSSLAKRPARVWLSRRLPVKYTYMESLEIIRRGNNSPINVGGFSCEWPHDLWFKFYEIVISSRLIYKNKSFAACCPGPKLFSIFPASWFVVLAKLFLQWNLGNSYETENNKKRDFNWATTLNNLVLNCGRMIIIARNTYWRVMA